MLKTNSELMAELYSLIRLKDGSLMRHLLKTKYRKGTVFKLTNAQLAEMISLIKESQNERPGS